MPNYATTSELEDRFPSTADAAFATDTESTGVPDTAVLTDALEAAEGAINSRLAKRYATPVVVSGNTELTALLKRYTLDLAEYHLLCRSDRVSEVKKERADNALEWAGMIAKGEWVLSGAVTPPSTASRDPLAEWSDSEREIPETSGRITTRNAMAQL